MSQELIALAKYGRHLSECCSHRVTDFGCICGLNDYFKITAQDEREAVQNRKEGFTSDEALRQLRMERAERML